MPKLQLDKLWQQRKIFITTEDLATREEGSYRMDGEILGPLGVHRSMEADGTWSVTCITLGLRMARFEELKDAKLFAQTIFQYCPEPFRFKNKDVVLGAVPRKLEKWILACAKAKKYLPL